MKLSNLVFSILVLGLTLCFSNLANAQNDIVGGTYAQAGDFPYLVSVARAVDGGTSICGGSLIDKRWVLTAAHCVSGGTADTIQVRVDSLNLSSGGQVVNIEYYSVPSGYIFGSARDNDIALIKLAQDVTSVAPIKLAGLFENSLLVTGTTMAIAGWGRTTSTSTVSEYLMKATVPIYDQAQCAANYSSALTITDYLVCAGDTGISSCLGDSGGPLVLNDSSGKYVSGVVNSIAFINDVPQCGSSRYPMIYTRVARHLDWIKSTSGIGAPAKVVMITPSGNTQDTSPSFSWNSVAGAQIYEVNVQIQGPFGSSDVTYGGVSTTSLTLPEGIQGTYTIKVKAVAGIYSGEYSNPLTLVIYKAPPAPVFSVVSTGVKRPTISWSSVQGATQYQVYIKSVSVPADIIDVTVSGTSYTPTRDLRVGLHDVWMKTSAPGIAGAWSAPKRISVNFDALVFTVVTTGVKRPTISWSAVSGATQYQVFIQSVSVPTDVINLNVTGTSYTPTRDLRAGLHDIWMRASAPGVVGTWSAVKRIAVNFDAPVFTVVTTGVKRPKISWSAVSGAAQYQVYIQSISAPTDIINLNVTGTSYTPTRDLRVGSHDVWMRALSPGVSGTWSAAERITVR